METADAAKLGKSTVLHALPKIVGTLTKRIGATHFISRPMHVHYFCNVVYLQYVKLIFMFVNPNMRNVLGHGIS